MTAAKNQLNDEDFRKEVEELAFKIRQNPTRRKKEFEHYAVRTMAVLDECSRWGTIRM